jgi:parvulin-like peptidyl-prolyl isomerase
VNGEGIRYSSYEASLKQFQAAQTEFGNLLEEGETAETRVMDALINRALLSQAARKAGFAADETMVNDRMTQLTEQAGGSETLASWLGNNGYTQETFLIELAIEIEAAWQRDQIVSTVPETAEQVKARQVFFYDAYQAFRIYNQLTAGISFDVIVTNNDPQNKGHLDWFPRGYLFYPELEAAAFSLQPGEFSEVIETEIGYHILQVLEYDSAHQLSTDARLTMQTRVLEEWLTQQRDQSQVEIFSP